MAWPSTQNSTGGQEENSGVKPALLSIGTLVFQTVADPVNPEHALEIQDYLHDNVRAGLVENQEPSCQTHRLLESSLAHRVVGFKSGADVFIEKCTVAECRV